MRAAGEAGREEAEAAPPPLLDVRPEEAFRAGHAAAAAHIPLEELGERAHELPASREAPLLIFDAAAERAERAREALRARGYGAAEVAGPDALRAAGPWLEGPARTRLWSANDLLVRLMPRLRAEAAGRAAIDLACGSGRDAVFLAEHGFDVEAVDILPDALERARDLARRSGVTLRLSQRDLEQAAPDLGRVRYDLVIGLHFLWRPLFPAIRRALRPGGLVLWRTFDVRERARSGHPRSDKHLLQPGELRSLLPGLEVLHTEEGADARGRLLQGLLARRPPLDAGSVGPAGPAPPAR